MSYAKLDCGILESSLWLDRDARDVFITAILMARPRSFDEPTPELATRQLEETGWTVPPGEYGFVEAAGVGIVTRAGLDRADGLAALARLAEPDPDSRSVDHEGRRLVRVDGGFIVLNFAKYREKDHTATARKRRQRERLRSRDVTPCHAVTPRDTPVTSRHVTQAEAEAEAEQQRRPRARARSTEGANLADVIAKTFPALEQHAEALGESLLGVAMAAGCPVELAIGAIHEAGATLDAGKPPAELKRALVGYVRNAQQMALRRNAERSRRQHEALKAQPITLPWESGGTARNVDLSDLDPDERIVEGARRRHKLTPDEARAFLAWLRRQSSTGFGNDYELWAQSRKARRERRASA